MTILPLADRNPGEYPLELLPQGWENVKITFRHTDGRLEKRVEILDLNEQKRYLQEPMAMVAFKCFGLFLLVLPFYFLGYTWVHLARLPLASFLNLSPSTFVKQIWKIARIPIYFVALEFAALYGVFNPIEGRAMFGRFESALHDGKTRRESEQYQKQSTPVWNAFASIDNKTSFFVGYCMQPVGNISDGHIVSYEILPKPIPAL